MEVMWLENGGRNVWWCPETWESFVLLFSIRTSILDIFRTCCSGL